MLESIELRNFQCHKLKRIDLDPGINWITGTSDSGKSAVIRAVEWVRTNRPRGSAFVRHGARGCRVTITTRDGHKISRTRSGKTNNYHVDGNAIEGSGSSVPDLVTETLMLQDINVQRQHDSPFLLSETAGEVGRKLNSFVDLGVIDRSIRALNSTRNKIRSNLEFQSNQIEQVKRDLGRRKDLPAIDGVVSAMEALSRDFKSTVQKIASLKSISSDVAQTKERIENTARKIDLLVPKIQDLEIMQGDMDALAARKRMAQEIVDQVEQIKLLLSKNKTVQEISRMVGETAQSMEQSMEINQKKSRLADLLSGIRSARLSVRAGEENLATERLWAQENLEGIPCPTCGKEMDGDE